MTEDLYSIAEKENVTIYYPRIGHYKSILFPDILSDTAAVLIDKQLVDTEREEYECLAHELGHFETGSCYMVNTLPLTIAKREYTADVWASQTLLPFEELSDFLRSGVVDIWEIAEATGRSEEFVRRAIEIYTRQGLLPLLEENEI